jgi:hypothetical protein
LAAKMTRSTGAAWRGFVEVYTAKNNPWLHDQTTI